MISIFQLLKHKAEVNFVNEHGNSPLHYATFWNFPAIAEDLVEWGAVVAIENKYGETPLEKCQPSLAKKLHERAAELGQDLRKREFKDLSWLGLKTRSRDATLSRHKGININELYLHTKIAQTPTGMIIFQGQNSKACIGALTANESNANLDPETLLTLMNRL